MAVRIGSNIDSLRAQRNLSDSSLRTSQSFERLSSGLRINRPSDDAAGLAVASGLEVKSRIYSTALRNVNDAVSLLAIGEGALQSLSSIVIRIKELATQAASGTLGDTQRRSLNTEAQALRDEWNRVTASTQFNGISVVDGSLRSLRIQQGFDSTTFGVGSELARWIGDGTLQGALTYNSVGGISPIEVGDLNGDGVTDVAIGGSFSNRIQIYLSNADGTLRAPVSYTAGSAYSLTLADANGDGSLDVITGDRAGNSVSVYLNNGNGTFLARVTYDVGASVFDVRASDLNGDGRVDIMAIDNSGRATFLNNAGSGTFTAGTSYAIGTIDANNIADRSALVDVNGDGAKDLLIANETSNTFSVLLGNGNGSFSARTSYSLGTSTSALTTGDFNGDGITDLAIMAVGGIHIAVGNGDGTFRATYSYIHATNLSAIRTADLNDDGNLDLVIGDGTDNTVSIYLGNSDGTFRARRSYAAGRSVALALGDLNGDGVLEVLSANNGNSELHALFQNTQLTTRLERFDLSTRSGALTALGTMDAALLRLNKEIGMVGAHQSRLAVSHRILSTMGIEMTSAGSRIRDTDVAQETAELVRNQILQQAGAAVLAQANLVPSLALTLLGQEER